MYRVRESTQKLPCILLVQQPLCSAKAVCLEMFPFHFGSRDKRNRYSGWLQAGRPRGTSSSAGRGKIVSYPRRPDRLWGPPGFLRNGHGGRRPGREADHSPPTGAEVKSN
jgi:hypothetical protein